MEVAEDGELREILRHNRDEEKEHAAMVLEWIRRRDPAFDEKPREGKATVCRPEVVLLAEVRAELSLPWPAMPMGIGFLTGRDSPRVRTGDWTQPGRMIADVLKAVEILDTRGIGGPYELVLSPTRYFEYLQAEGDHGYPAARQLREVMAGVHRSAVVHDAGAVFSARGNDFMLSVGGDLSVGYRLHDRDAVHLFCVETIGSQTATPAVCVLDP